MIRVVVILAAFAMVAHAQPRDEARAKQRYALGKQLVAQGKFADAYDAFSAGYELSHRPLFLFNMGECKRALHDAAHARELYKRYVADDPSGDLVDTAQARVAELGPEPEPALAPAPAPTPVVAIPPPAVAAAALPVPEPSSPMFHDEPTPLLQRKALWIGIGVGVAVIAGSALIYAETRHHDTMACSPPMCVSL
jgi:tetratricopeptide (TPR) repeat protein